MLNLTNTIRRAVHCRGGVALRGLIVPTTAALSLAASVSVAAQDFEPAPTLKASAILPHDLLNGPDHRVDEAVRNDGYLNHYRIQSRYGQFDAVSTATLRKRVDEIRALASMDQLEGTKVFGDAAMKAGRGAVRGVTNLVTDPVGSVEGAVSGVGKVFGRVGEGLFGSTRSTAEDGRVASLIGFSTTKREYAAAFGVDPYSRNKVLQDRLDDIAWTGFAGDLAPNLALSAIPGGAGVVLSVTQNTEMLNDVFRTTAPIDLRKMNREKLIAMGVTRDVADLFIDNAAYTPREQTLLVAALERMKGVQGRAHFIRFAVHAQDPDVTYFRQRQAQMYAGYHEAVTPIVTFVPVGQLAGAQLSDSTLVFAVPLDLLSWTDQMGTFIANADAYINETLKPTAKQLWLAGGATELATSNMAARGWTLTTNGESRLLPSQPY